MRFRKAEARDIRPGVVIWTSGPGPVTIRSNPALNHWPYLVVGKKGRLWTIAGIVRDETSTARVNKNTHWVILEEEVSE
jgi:hypothetical protein